MVEFVFSGSILSETGKQRDCLVYYAL